MVRSVLSSGIFDRHALDATTHLPTRPDETGSSKLVNHLELANTAIQMRCVLSGYRLFETSIPPAEGIRLELSVTMGGRIDGQREVVIHGHGNPGLAKATCATVHLVGKKANREHSTGRSEDRTTRGSIMAIDK